MIKFIALLSTACHAHYRYECTSIKRIIKIINDGFVMHYVR